MNIYLATHWGNVEDGGNGPDTNLLISASTFESARAIAENWAIGHDAEKNESVMFEPDMISLLGTQSTTLKERVIHGPWIKSAILSGEFDQRYRETDWTKTQE